MEDIIQLTSDDGTVLDFEFLDYVKYEGVDYAVMLLSEEDTGDADIFKVLGDEEYEYVSDEELGDKIFDKFREENEDYFQFDYD